MDGEKRPREVRAEDAARFEGLWAAAEEAVRKVFAGARHAEVEDMVQWVAERGLRSFATGLALEAEAKDEGKEFGWVGWFVTIAVNVLRDEKRRERTLRRQIGRPTSLAGRLTEVCDDGVRSARRLELQDTRWGTVEEHAHWAVMVTALHAELDKRPRLQRNVLLGWGHWPNDAWVARKLKITAGSARRLRVSGLIELRPPLEARGYTAENRPRQPMTTAWGFYERAPRARGPRGIKEQSRAA